MVQERDSTPKESTALFIARALVRPSDDQLPDVSNISLRMSHPLTMLKALMEQMDVFITQIQNRQKWQVRRYVRQQVLLEKRRIAYYTSLKEKAKTKEEADKISIPKELWTTEAQIAYISESDKGIKETDKFDKMNMFASDFILQYCHFSRGKEFKLGDTMQILADSEITNSNNDNDNGSIPIRPG